MPRTPITGGRTRFLREAPIARALWRRRIAHDPSSALWLTEVAEQARELRRAIAELDRAADGSPAATATPSWDAHRRMLRRRLLEDDPMEFLTWEFVLIGMGCARNDWARAELAELRRAPDWKARWRPALAEDPIGMPRPLPRYPRSSAGLIHHAYHLLTFERMTGVRMEELDSILEFGGGYGGMRRLVARLGYRGGYHINDLPEMIALQRYYLGAVAAVRSPYRESWATSYSDDLADVPSVSPGRTLFLATWSLSEIPVALRERWLPILASFSWFLIGYQNEYYGIDNRSWFLDVVVNRPDVAWHHMEIAHRPGTYYLIGAPPGRPAHSG